MKRLMFLVVLMVIVMGYTTPVSSSKYRIVYDAKFLVYGDSEMETVFYCAPTQKERDIEAITKILSQYSSPADAKKTAQRYCEDPEDDPYMWAAMDINESTCNSKAVSSAGAQGRLQVMPFWKLEKGFEFYRGKNSHLNDDLNFKAAKKVYKGCYDRHGQRKWLAVERYCGVGPDAREYVKKVKRTYKEIRRAQA